MKPIRAIYENGVFRPLDPVDLPEGCHVELVIKVVNSPEDAEHRKRVEATLSRRYSSGHHDTAERHNEHQP